MDIRDVLLGPGYLHHKRLIQQSRQWSLTEIAHYQETRIARLTRRYGDTITVKDDYRRYPGKFARWALPPLTYDIHTGGSTYAPLFFKGDTLIRRQKECAYIFDIWSEVGYKPYDLRVMYRDDTSEQLIRFNRMPNVWVISPQATTEGRLAELRLWIRTIPPFFLHIYPSAVYPFIDLLGDDLFRSLPIRGVLAGSESFPLGERRQFELEYGIRIAHWYGHSEYAALAYACRDCDGFHFYPTYGAVEMQPSDTEHVWRIVASSFNRIGTQFVRYDTEDMATSPHGTCATTNYPRVGEILGRAAETFVDRYGRKRAVLAYVPGCEGGFWDGIRDMQFLQKSAGRLEIKLVVEGDSYKETIEETFLRTMPMVDLHFEYVGEIARRPNGKRQYVV